VAQLRLRRLHKAGVLGVQRAVRPLVPHILVSNGRLFLFARASSVSCVSNRKRQVLALRDVGWVVAEAVQEFPLHIGLFSSVLLSLLAQLLELESLEIDLLKALHSGVVLDGTLEGALGDLGEAGKRLHFEVTSVDELVYVFLVNLFELFLECPIVFWHLEGGVGGRIFNFRLGRLLFTLVLRLRPLIPKVMHSRDTLFSSIIRFVYVLDFLVLIPPPGRVSIRVGQAGHREGASLVCVKSVA
jgi:hypothetical protein